MSENPPGMSGQPFAKPEVTYHEHFDAQVAALKEFVVQGFQLRDTAGDGERALRDRVATSDALALSEKLARLNELREIVSTVMANSATKSELTMARDNVESITRAIAAELRGEMVTSHNFRIAHDEAAKKIEVAQEFVTQWEKVEQRIKPLEKAQLVADTKASQSDLNMTKWVAGGGLLLAGVSLVLRFFGL